MTRMRNALGDLFPTETPALMAQALGIQAGERVLDIGGGHSPLPEATVVVEYNLKSGHDRDGHVVALDSRYVEGDAQDLQFPDQDFDFAYASHVFEHVRDPGMACKEMMRVARRGYIETPRKMTELVAGYPSHRWLVDVIDGVLTFERRWFIESPFQNAFLAHVHNYAGARDQALVHFRNQICVQFPWEGAFAFKIVERPGWQNEFDYDNPVHAGWSHFYFALNLMANGDSWNNVQVHASTALDLLPNEGVFYLLSGVIHGLGGDPLRALEQFQVAKDIGCTDGALPENILSAQRDRGLFYLPLNRGVVGRASTSGRS